MTRKVLFLIFDPFSANQTITKGGKEYAPFGRIVSIEELSSGGLSEGFDYDRISFVVSTAGAAFHKCADEKRRSNYGENMILDEIMFDHKEQFGEQFGDPDVIHEE
ncbi:MAG: hypothetical protein Q4C06_08350 [Bacillota bacterium]|nr:hypothetical protein [Bacillota bacterium]